MRAVRKTIVLSLYGIALFMSVGQSNAQPAAPAEGLPAPGYCPANADATCAKKLQDYTEAYRALELASDAYNNELETEFSSRLFSDEIAARTKKFAEIAAQLKLKAAALSIRVNGAAPIQFVTTLADIATAKSEYNDALMKWQADPLTSRKPVDDKEAAHAAKLRQAYALAAGFAAYPEALESLKADFDTAATEVGRLRDLIGTPDSFAKTAAEMSALLQKNDPLLKAAYERAKAAAENAARAGAKLDAKPVATGSTGGTIVIVDALYGDATIMGQVAELWEKNKGTKELSSLVALEASSTRFASVKFCNAKNYVQDRCEFDRLTVKLCLHEKALTDPAFAGSIAACDAATPYKIQETSRVYVRETPRAICHVPINDEACSGGPPITKPERERVALILYRCGLELQPLKLVGQNMWINLRCKN